MASLTAIRQELRQFADRERATNLQWFFKTGPGEYGEGDRFLGVTMPEIRQVARRHRDLPLPQVEKLLSSQWHEERMCALVIMTLRYPKAGEAEQRRLKDNYLKNARFINNWDLVDVSVHKIVGEWLAERPTERQLLDRLAASKNLWERRMSIIATFAFISRDQFDDSLRLAAKLLKDKHDLMHKAVGWTLREVGNRDLKAMETFLKRHYKEMPRTMLRYAIEKLPEHRRQAYLKGRV